MIHYLCHILIGQQNIYEAPKALDTYLNDWFPKGS